MKTLKLKIFRGNGREGEFKTYKVEVEEGDTLLSLLQKVKEEDETLSFRQFCRAGICGTCAVEVNGFPKLICKERAKDYLYSFKEVILTPLRNFKVIKDLVCEHERTFKLMKELKLHLEPLRENIPLRPQEVKEISFGSDCILCNACQSYCPQIRDEKYLGPLFFAKLHRFFKDRRDKEKDRKLNLALEGKLFFCLSCNKCNNVCPKEVKPADLIRELFSEG